MRADVLQRKVIEFANLMSTGTKAMDSMEIGRLERQRQGAPATRWADQEDEEWEDPWQQDLFMQNWGQEAATPGDGAPVPISAVDTKRHKCGGIGHYASQRPSGGGGGGGGGKKGEKGKKGGKNGGKQQFQKGQWPGKGPGKGPGPKGKGGPKDGCWTCGGPHFGYERPQGQAGSKGGQKGYPGIKSLGTLGSLRTVGKGLKDINVLPAVWGEDEEQLVSWDPAAQPGPTTVPVPTPACQHQYKVFRKARTTRISTNMATVVGRETSKVTTKDNSIGGQSFYKKLDLVKSVAIRTLPTVKRATVSVGSRFQKLQVPEMAMFGDSACGADPEIRPSGMASPLTVKGSGGLSRADLGSGIPVMGGVTGGKKLGVSGRSYKDVVTAKSAVELSVKKVEKRKCSEGLALREAPHVSRECIGGLALREAPHVSHGGSAQVPVIGTAVSPTDRLLCSARSQAKVVGRAADNNPKLGMLGIRMPSGLNAVEEAAPEWEEIEMAVDSGASESVVSEDRLNGVETLEGKATKMGVQYEVAD